MKIIEATDTLSIEDIKKAVKILKRNNKKLVKCPSCRHAIKDHASYSKKNKQEVFFVCTIDNCKNGNWQFCNNGKNNWK